MILEFRTRGLRNGDCRYLAINTDSKKFSTNPRPGIFTVDPSDWSRENVSILSVGDYEKLIEWLERKSYTKILERIC